MKIIQFVHPMFLAALGLHASLLFVPLGGESEPELLEEDVPLAELTEDARKAASSPTPEKLPVPDLNVNAVTKTGAPTPAQAALKKASPAAVVQARPAPVPVTPAAQPAQVSAKGATAASGSSAVGDAIRSAASSGNDAPGGASQNSSSVTTPVVSATPADQPTSFIPDLSTPAEDESASNAGSDRAGNAASSEDANEAGATIPVENQKLASLLGAISDDTAVPTALEDSVLALQDALLYRPEETTDEVAEQMREAWISAVSRQASGANNIERIDPADYGLALAYPMASSVLRNGRSLDVCLDEAPSKAEVGVLFDAQGELAIDPQILRSTGYKGLDMEIIALLKQDENLASTGETSLPEDRSSNAYIFEVSVDYDKDQCVNLNELQSDA